nr:hypothetical protein [Tanacetum cinerariifolium]
MKSLKHLSEVENQLGKTIKAIRSDRGGEYISQQFKDYLKACEIVQQLTPPYTPQHNGVSERRNRTLLNMVRSTMSLATLPLSFWDYDLESAARILNMVPTKKVDKTPYELWNGKVSNLSYLRVWGCYYLYYLPENKIVVERYADFLEKDFILQKESGRIIELKDDEDILPSENTSEHPIEEALIVSQEEDVILVRRSVRTHKVLDRLCLNVEIDPDRLCFNVKVEEHNLGDLNEPANYKAALSDPEFEKWLVAINAKMQSMYDNKVWRLVVLPPNAKVVKSKWIYKKKTYMDGKRYRMDNSKRGSIPMQVDLHLSKSQCATTSAEMKRMQNVPYASAVGSIMYDVRCTRPDVSYELTIIVMLDSKPIEMTQNLKLPCLRFEWRRGAAKEAVWIRKFIDELGVVPSTDYPIKINYDNSVAIIMAKELEIQKGAKHFKRKYHYVHECIETDEIDIVKVYTDDNLADPFTKALTGPKLTRHARSMGLRPASSFM